MLKALIVDDEPFIRKGILNKIDWNSLGVDIPQEANDAFEALEYIHTNSVDIILTDIKMPEMDGLMFVEKVKADYGDRHSFIIISGFGEFEYARKAMKFGIDDYLLKPVNEEELEGTVKKLVTEITSRSLEKKYKKMLESNYSSSRDLRSDKIFSSLIIKNSEEMFVNENARAGVGVIDFKYDYFTVLALKVDNIEYLDSGFCDKDEELILFAVRNILEDTFPLRPKAYVFMNIRNEREYIIIFNSDSGMERENIKRLASEAISNLKKYIKLKATIGIGKTYHSSNDIHKSYSQAKFALREKLLRGPGMVYDVLDIHMSNTDTGLFNEDYKKLFQNYLQEGNRERIFELLDNLFDKKLRERFFHNHSSVYELCMEFYIFLGKYVKHSNKNLDELIGEKYEFIDTIMELGSLEEVSVWLKNTCSNAIDYVLKDRRLTGEDIVQEVKTYINRNYSSDITLSFIAQKYFIHPNYFCRLFKNMVGESFSEYITGIRIKKAKDFLADSSLRLNKVSELVGYEDPRYFSQVFKKYVGISPSEYQTSIQKEGNVQ